MSAKVVTDSTFQQEVLNSNNVVLVDFWAEWCGPCRALGPKLDEISTELNGKMTVAKVNVDENPETPAKYGVRSIPTLILFKNGQEVDQIIGNHPKENIKALIEKHTN
ncbi:MAG: thioredoxin [Bdellovibrionales bacterium]|nr:thioredoxin [Bdellovibrionales bacterium]